jgi:hypothetical protein
VLELAISTLKKCYLKLFAGTIEYQTKYYKDMKNYAKEEEDKFMMK